MLLYEIMKLNAITAEWLEQYFSSNDLVDECENEHLVSLALADRFEKDDISLTLRLEVKRYASAESGSEAREAFQQVARFFN